MDEEPVEDAPRYSEAAGVEHHPQVTDFVPRKFRSIGTLALLGVGATAAVELLHWFAAPLAATYGFESTAAFDLKSNGNFANWLSAMAFAAAALVCWLIYTLRRHRIDDFRGRYRVWMAAAAACLLMSIESVTPLHRFMAAVSAYHSGWTALRGHAVWWLVLAGLPLCWIALRTWLDVRESRLAAVALGAAAALFALATSSYVGVVGSDDNQAMITAGATLLGAWMTLVGIVSYARFVVLDAQGLIPLRASKRSSTNVEATQVAAEMKAPPTITMSRTAATRTLAECVAASVPSANSSTQWVDGTAPLSESYDDEEAEHASYKLGKSDRKRIRKQKRAA